MKRIEFHPDAERDLLEAQAWYRERSEVAAQALALEVDRAVRVISEGPERWPPTAYGDRRFVLSRFPYSILYRVRLDDVFITAVAHQRRRPGYWRHRK